jgi:hypothetical protein
VTRNAFSVAVLFLVALTFAQVAPAQDPPHLAGTWYITIQNFSGPGTAPHQGRWILQQDGTKITGIGKNPNGDLSLAGTLAGKKLRMQATPANDTGRHNDVQATVNDEVIEGTITMGNKDEHGWQANRYPTVAGEWNLLTSGPGPQLRAQWSIEQNGAKITGRLKDGNGEFALAGALAGPVLRMEVTAGDRQEQVEATMDVFTNSMDGTLKINGKQYLLSARRPPAAAANAPVAAQGAAK